MIPELFPFQMDLYQRVRQRLVEGKRVIVVQGATGCGKNTWAAYVVKQAVDRGRRVLFMVHRRKLVDQISERLLQFQVQHGIIMRGEQRDFSCLVQVASRDTLLSRCVNNEWIGMPPGDLILVDEAHHAARLDSEYRRIIARYPDAFVLLLSATPVGPDGKGLGPWAQAIECAAPTSQLVKEGYLMPVRVYAPDRKRKGKRFQRGIAGDLVESWKTYAEDRPTVLFCSRVQHSLDAVAAFEAAGIAAAHLDANTDDDDRESILEAVAHGRIKVVSNVGIIGEGVDLPELACCQLFSEFGSRTRFLQACGRVMRRAPGKTHGILIDHAGAVFQHGFPDEDTEWTLEGNVDLDFAEKHKRGETEKAFYCKRCEIAFHGQPTCPQCGRAPSKPPRSIFAPPPQETTDELLVEADRGQPNVYSVVAKQKHWLSCVAAAFHRGGSFGMAAQIYKRKYNEWPMDGFPCMPPSRQWKTKVSDVYPNFGRKKAEHQ